MHLLDYLLILSEKKRQRLCMDPHAGACLIGKLASRKRYIVGDMEKVRSYKQ